VFGTTEYLKTMENQNKKTLSKANISRSGVSKRKLWNI